MIETADRRLSHTADTFWLEGTDPHGVLLGACLSGFRSAERAEHFARTAIDGGRYQHVTVFDRALCSTIVHNVERRVVTRPVLTERRAA